MMQELQTVGTSAETSGGTVSGRSFNVLFALAGSNSMDARSLGSRLGISERESRRIIEDLHTRYLVDVVSGLEGNQVKERLQLTDEGEGTLLRSLEQMCELPEFLRD